MESDLDLLETATTDESDSLAFFCAAVGAIPGLMTACATTAFTPSSVAIIVAIGGIDLICLAWFGIRWRRMRGAHRRLVARIKATQPTTP